jgi:squalene-hopene/tetraprenyl-beta-curcumene cyclase
MATIEQTKPGISLESVDDATQRCQSYLLRIQHQDGYWWGKLESNPTMEAEYLLLTHFLGVAVKARWQKITHYLLREQHDDGSWGQYYGGPGDLSTSVECYFALKLAGVPACEPAMVKARQFVLSKGGVPRARTFTKIWLSLFGQWEWKNLPMMPPELMLLPTWAPVNIYDFASWSRATIVPLLIVMNKKVVCPIPIYASIDELFPEPYNRSHLPPKPRRLVTGWRGFFLTADRLLRIYEHVPWKPLRTHAFRKAEKWILEHQEADGSWAGIQPPWAYSLIALKMLGYSADHPAFRKGVEGFEGFAVEEDGTWQVQACLSPVWDTCLTLLALQDSGLPTAHAAAQKAARWLADKQIRVGGDWQVKVRNARPGGWAFEFINDTYPDIDDSAEVIMSLNGARLIPDEDGRRRMAIKLGVEWVLAMQSRNGGWASFDRDNTKSFLANIPFADFGELLDPPSVDVTAHVVEMLGKLGYTAKSSPVTKALKYLRSEQEEDGCWFGRWGVNYIYGTGAVLPALEAVGENMTQPYIERAVKWLTEHQNPDGGWGESCASYADPNLRGHGPSTASQTAWALLGLLAAGETSHPATRRGVEYLVRMQKEEGCWDEPQFTGTGFPGYGVGKRLVGKANAKKRAQNQGVELSAGFMINYNLYRNYWPLMALGRYMQLATRQKVTGEMPWQ